MRIPLAWLRSYCDPGLPAAGLAERLDMTGTEVERIESVGVGSADGFVVGRVLSAEPHPDADRLRVCAVDDGSGEPRTIVCGAPNVAGGQTVALALPGAAMPGGTTLGEARLRGVTSSGMILSEDELGIGEDHAGIMVLPDWIPPGAPLSEHAPISDEVLELEITPNRPDCLAVYGIARELHAATGAPLAESPTAGDAEPAGDDRASDHATVEIAEPDICLRFTARVFEDVRVGPSPAWLKQRLAAAGQRSISNVVDITNYVMLTCGQPLHAFDLDEVRGARIVVRGAQPGERIVTLDGEEHELPRGAALVCDAEGPSGIAGIKGGRSSEVSPTTTRVLMEAATWVGPNILRTSKALALRSEASARFEKQLHPDLAIEAQRLAARLMVELCGARMVPGTLDAYPHPVPQRTVELRPARLERLLGQALESDEIVEILGRLGFATTVAPEGTIAVAVPAWRDTDVRREADLIEEVARIHGLDRLPSTLPARRRAVGRLTPAQRLRRRLEDALRDRGLSEVVSWSFVAPATLERLRLEGGAQLTVSNPLSEEQAVMRPLLLPGLLDAATHNAARGTPGLALFESAHVYEAGDGREAPQGSPRGVTPARERHHLAALMTRAAPGGWRSAAAPADFHAARAVVEALLAAAGLAAGVEPCARPFLHPGRAARVVTLEHGRELGWIGELHPLVARAWDIERAACFELDADLLAAEAPAGAPFEDLTSYPAVREDIAVVAPLALSAAEIEAAVRAGGGELLRGARVFDVYTGEQVAEGSRSLALRLEFRAPDRTLTDEHVAGSRADIEAALAAIGGRLRG
ncbi:MAG: phenylalanine--tRNA ligase subunit beta [Thermoleophilaceae bacterium]